MRMNIVIVLAVLGLLQGVTLGQAQETYNPAGLEWNANTEADIKETGTDCPGGQADAS